MNSWDGAVDNDANAEFIVRAVNSHKELVKALKLLVDGIEREDEYMGYSIEDGLLRAKQALAKAEGK